MSEPTAFDDIRALFALMPEPSRAAIAAVEQRQRHLTKPARALGRLEELVAWLAGWQSRDMPTLNRPLVAVFMLAGVRIVVPGWVLCPTRALESTGYSP